MEPRIREELNRLRWYVRVKKQKYHLIHWWLKADSMGRDGGAVDMRHAELTALDVRGRPGIRREPWTWEILRRHPGFQPLLNEHRRIRKLCPGEQSNSDDLRAWVLEREAFLNPWLNRGANLIEFMAERAHLAWFNPSESGDRKKSSKKSNAKKPTALNAGERRRFESLLDEFAKDPRNFATGVRLPSPPLVSRPLVPPESIASPYLFQGPRSFRPKSPGDYTIDEYRAFAAEHSKELIFLEFRKGSSRTAVIKAVEEHLRSLQVDLEENDGNKTGRRSMRLNEQSLERVVLLDSGGIFDMPPGERTDAIKMINGVFNQFRLVP